MQNRRTHRSLARAVVLPVFAALLAGACGAADAGRRWEGTVDTLPNGAVRVTSGERGMWRAGEGVRLVPELRIGSVDGDGPHVFGQAIALEVGRDGRIYVLDRQVNELRIFGPDGAHVRTVGRSGRGPAEYVAANGLVWLADDTLVVADGQGARYSILTADGDFVRSMPRSLGSFGWVMQGGVSDRLLYESAGYIRNEVWVQALMGVVLGDSAIVRDTIPVPWADVQPRYPSLTIQTERGGMSMGRPFAPGAAWLLDGRGGIWYGQTDEYRIQLRSMAGDTLREIVAVTAPVPVTSEELDEWEASTGPQRFREMGGRIDRSTFPTHKPLWRALLLNENGELWVEVVNAGGTSDFDIFDPDGRLLGRVETGARRAQFIQPRLRHDRLYFIAVDDLDVQYLYVFRVEALRG